VSREDGSWEDGDVIEVDRTNTILYCDRWRRVVDFYRHALGLDVVVENDWFVEFVLAPGSFLSVADATRSSIAPGVGAGLTLSWRVADVADTRATLLDAGISVSQVGSRFGCPVIDLHDPAGNRIELWSGAASG
jgi:catechol 2,3-dioxygenase-like lactoylglutathione lyase family enzyme